MDDGNGEHDGQLWRAFVQASPDVVLVLDAEGTVLFSNRVVPAFGGKPVVGHKFWEFASGDDAEQRLREQLHAVCHERRSIRYEHPGYLEDGSLGWYEVRAVPVILGDGAPRALWSATDITVRKTTQQRLEASEGRFRSVIEQGADCIVMFDAEGRISYASPSMERALGYEGKLVRSSVVAIVHPDDRAMAFGAGRGGTPGVANRRTLRIRHADGSYRWYEGTSTNLLHDPAVRAVVSVSRDVTADKATRERLAFQAAVLAQVNEPVVATTLESIITYWNESATRLFGWSAEEAIGRYSDDLFHPSYPRGHDELVRAIRATDTWHGEILMTNKKGDVLTIEASVRVIREMRAGITVMKDITQRRALEDQLRQSQKMEAVGLLAGGIAHDFNNLLAVILGFSELASSKLPPGHPVALQLTEVFDAARRGGELTRKLLAFSRKQIIQPRAVDAGVAIDSFSRLLSRVLGEDVELQIDRPARPILVRADPVQLEQVLLNLGTNARQAMPEGGKLRLSTRLVTFDEEAVRRRPWARVGAYAEITVGDTGVGMDKATQAHLFEPFFTTKHEGTGLGLATVYGIVQQHGGFMHVESEPGAGATFHVYLPCADDSVSLEGGAAVERRGERRELGLGGGEMILVAEDEPSLRAIVSATLVDLGYRVETASDGEEALRLYAQRSQEVALVLLDVVMPKLATREAYERIQALRPGAKVLLMTGYAPESTHVAQLVQGGRVPILEKPFTAQALAAKVRSVLDAPAPPLPGAP